MSSKDKNLSHFSGPLPNGKGFCIGISRAVWNKDVTESLLDGAISFLLRAGVSEEKIVVREVPGTFELALAAQQMAKNPEIDGVICLGCVIQGETRHFDFICNAASQGIMDVGLKFNKPVVFGVLTTENMEQALDRAGGKHGNKGEEAAYSVLKLLEE